MLPVLLAVLAAPFGPRADDSLLGAAFDDAAFVKAVAIGGMYEGRLSYLVGPHSRNRAVRRFAVEVVAGHIVGGTELKAVAKDMGIELPTELDDTHRKLYEAFEEYKGDDLDGDFVKAMAARHAVAVVLFTRASKQAKNPAVKKFATTMLPRIEKHLEAVRKLDK
jgi:putative membrane protein